jgi:hypothetical protein
MAAERKVVTPVDSFDVSGRAFHKGRNYYADDPDLKGREHLVQPAASIVVDWKTHSKYAPVEQATAAPGEKRTRRPKQVK